MVPPAYPAPVTASMAAAAKQPRKAVQSNYHQSTSQQHAAEDEQMSLKDLLQQLHVVVEDLAVLDSSLTALFETAPNTDVTEHQQLVQFRSRVARRISRYGQLSKNLAQIVEKIISCNSSQPLDASRHRESFHPRQLHELDALLKQHQQRLQKYKSQFAAWWQNTERHFHTMRMANYVCSVQERSQTALGVSAREGPSAGPSRSGGPRVEPVRAKATAGEQLAFAPVPPKSQDGAVKPGGVHRVSQPVSHNQQLLQETGQAMVKEVQRMQATEEQLQQSSSALEQTESSYNVFGARLSSATGMLQALKKRYTIPWMPSAASGYQGEKAESSRWHPGTKQYIDVKKKTEYVSVGGHELPALLRVLCFILVLIFTSASDSELIWFAFLFFLGCCAFVLLRRLGLLKLVLRVAFFSLRHSVSLALWTADRITLAVEWVWEKLLGGYNESDELLGSSDFDNLSIISQPSPITSPAVSKLLATSAASAIAAPSTRSKLNPTHGAASNQSLTLPEMHDEREWILQSHWGKRSQ
ncbi:hypothetical protein, conserved [Eimeria tenella]|uniref:Sec20 domain-containing protein n=1 Tax=Eimeria tenella TaxID=5802 RepID=U6L095_EIMTE|nr:hypothetical protein, conserved [Eimeria tenella]CDJ41989.1 hypothetical protein, conserved [Eimeria tenella]|eukprot:XP_013232739.1 hypothetical protein, conserved [Eimeria tenella]